MSIPSINSMTREINQMVSDGIPKAEIQSQMSAYIVRARQDARHAGLASAHISNLLLKTAYKRAQPLDASDALGRQLKAERQAAMGCRPEGIRARAGQTRAQMRYALLKEMNRRRETGLAFSCRGFLPYSPHGERLVKAGFARLTRSGTARSGRSMLHITTLGEKELARLEKKHAK